MCENTHRGSIGVELESRTKRSIIETKIISIKQIERTVDLGEKK